MFKKKKKNSRHKSHPLVARSCDSQDLSIFRRWLDIPEGFALKVIEDSGPRKLQWRRESPAFVFIFEPKANEMPLARFRVLKGLATMQDCHIVEEAHVALLHGRRDLVLLSNEVQSVQGFGLGLGETWDPFRTRRIGSVADQQAARDIQNGLALMEIEQGAAIVWWITTKPGP